MTAILGIRNLTDIGRTGGVLLSHRNRLSPDLCSNKMHVLRIEPVLLLSACCAVGIPSRRVGRRRKSPFPDRRIRLAIVIADRARAQTRSLKHTARLAAAEKPQRLAATHV